jgi:hypothetical protein
MDAWGALSRLDRILDGAVGSMVFGGMGSWNDMDFAGDAGREYAEVSEQLFSVLNDAICAATNETDAASWDASRPEDGGCER